MTVTYLGPGTTRTAKNSKGIRTYTRTGLFTTSDQDEGEYAVGSHASVPLIGSVHPEDPLAWCVDIQVENTNPWKGWTVTATWDSAVEIGENPLFEPAAIDWDGENFEEVLIVDRNGYAVLNSAGDPFENSMRERTRRVISVVKNVASVPSWILDAEDAVNSSTFIIDGFAVSAGLAKLNAPKLGRWQTRNGTSFRELTMQIKLNKDGWNYKPLDVGYRYKNGLDERIRIVNDDGTDITTPVCLDGTGLVLTNPSPASAVYGDFEQYPQYDFNLLPIT